MLSELAIEWRQRNLHAKLDAFAWQNLSSAGVPLWMDF